MNRFKRGWELVGLVATIVERLRLNCDVKIEYESISIVEISAAQKLEILREITNLRLTHSNLSIKLFDYPQQMVTITQVTSKSLKLVD